MPASPHRSYLKTARRIVSSRLTLAVLLILVLLLGRGVWGVAQKAHEAGEAREKRAAELEKLEARRETLQADLTTLNSERGIEAEVRESFGMARPGEHVLVLVDETATTSEPSDTGPSGMWGRIVRFFDWF